MNEGKIRSPRARGTVSGGERPQDAAAPVGSGKKSTAWGSPALLHWVWGDRLQQRRVRAELNTGGNVLAAAGFL